MDETILLNKIHESKDNADKLFKSCSDSLEDHQKELRELLKSVAVLSGAISVGALILIGAGTNTIEIFVLTGIIALFGEVFYLTFTLLN